LIFACLAAAILNGLLVGSAYIRVRAAEGLEAQLQTLRENFTTLAGLQAERRAQLESQVGAAEARIQAAEAALPPIEAPLDIFRMGYELAADSPLIVLSVHRASSEPQDTAMGPVDVTTYRIVANGTLQDCMAYIATLEAASPALGLAGVSILPEDSSCEMDVRTLARPR
jgi:hypothetical protein